MAIPKEFSGVSWAPSGPDLFASTNSYGQPSTTLSYGSIGMLAVMVASGHATAGRASAVVAFGFSAGISVGPALRLHSRPLRRIRDKPMGAAGVFEVTLPIVAMW